MSSTDDSKEAHPLTNSDYPGAFDVLRAVIEGTSDIVGAIDPEYRFTLLNEGYKADFSRVFGTEAKVGESLLDLLAHLPEDRANARAMFGRALGGETVRFRSEYGDPNRDRSTFELTFFPVRDAGGEIVGAATISRDVSALVHEEARREALIAERDAANEARLRTLENAEVATFDWDIPNDVVRTNARMDSVYGLPHVPAGRPVDAYWESIHPEDRERLKAAIQTSIEGGRRYEAEYRVRGFGGRERWVFARGDTVVTEDGHPLRLSGVVLNITNRVASEEARAESERRLRLALEAGRMGTWDIDLDTGRMVCSDTCKANYGRSGEDSFGYDDLADAVHPEDRSRWRRTVERAIASAQDFEVEYRVLWPDASLHWVQVRGSCVVGGEGTVVGLSGVSFEVTERRRMDEELRGKVAALDRKDREKDEFIATLSHELRNPLNAISVALQLAEPGFQTDEENFESFEIATRQVANMTSLVNDLLEVARLTQGKVRLKRQRVSLSDTLVGTFRAVGTNLPEDGRIRFVTEIEPGIAVDADPIRLDQIFQNLLGNALKFTSEGEIRLSLASEGDEAVVRIRDTGSGIDPAFLPYLFELFKQSDRSLARTAGGLGIGLTVTKQLVDLHGGTIEARSDGPGRGATFVVRLPLDRSESPAAREASQTPMTPATPNRLSILVVDDRRDAADLVARLLRRAGHEARTAYHGDDVIPAMLGRRPDLVLLDIGLPGKDGYEIAREIRADPALGEIRLVALTGYGQANDLKTAAEAGFDGHVLKPIGADALLTVLAETEAAMGIVARP